MYVDALFSKKQSQVKVVERVDGKRIYKDYPAIYEFYAEDPKGRFKGLHGESLTKFSCGSDADFRKTKRMNSNKNLFESDVKPVNKVLEKYYQHTNPAEMHVAFFDIETDFDRETGYSSPEDASNAILSVAVHLQWLGQTVCLAVPPKGMDMEEAKKIADRVGNTIMYYEEAHMLDAFLTLIEDADVLSGWYSEGFDIPYTVNRITRILGKAETRRMCLWNELPEMRMVARGGKESPTYDLVGRVHLDYLQLYKKFIYEQRPSWSLDAIAEHELGDCKVPYDGTLDALYNKDFEKFLRYNIQDTELLDKLDKKLQYIDLACSIAHGNSVVIKAAMGAVAVTEQAIIIEAHNRNVMVPDRVRVGEDDLPAAGGWVQTPKKGLHRWVGSSDLNSLYPSVLRALNMSPETIVGQVRHDGTDKAIRDFIEAAKRNSFTEWWNDRFNTLEMEHFFNNDNVERLTLDMADGSSCEVTGAELRKLVFESGNPWCISANGTIFRTDVDGVIPGLLGRWYAERKKLQAIKRDYDALQEGVHVDIRADVASDITENLERKREAGEVSIVNALDQNQVFSVAALKKKAESKNPEDLYAYMLSHNLVFDKQGLVHYADKAQLKKIIGFWDKRQLVKKISLNSLYGGLLNEHCRFYDHRLGQSTTLTGRTIARHMSAKTNEIIDNVYDHTGRSVLYGDTDSVYFSAYPILKDEIEAGEIVWNKESVVELYDVIGEQVSDSFPQFLSEALNVPQNRGNVMKSGREIVAETALFVTKKRYAALVYDEEGNRRDVDGKDGKLKITGLDLRRSDTPVIVQTFLTEVLKDVLALVDEETIIEKVRKFKQQFSELHPWEQGSPTAVNNLTRYTDALEKSLENKFTEFKKLSKTVANTEKLSIPGHVMASINWNRLRAVHNDLHTVKIVDGHKVNVCWLKDGNDMRMSSVAYPVEEPHLPDWFINLPFDTDSMMRSNVDKKVENLLGVLGWDLSRTTPSAAHMETLFDFS
jgi:DNA polymerase elongation subunit (family B)